MPIRKLPDNVISRISAGEVITSPMNILKELLENSIDANSSNISVILDSKNLGFTIRDNGDGIDKGDLEFLCQNHYTSKLSSLEAFKTQYEMLDTSTFGFRGEALYSISLCSCVKVITNKRCENEMNSIKNTVTSGIGLMATYNLGILTDLKEVAFDGHGTAIEISNIFYNNPIRLFHFTKNKAAFNQLLDLVKSYGILFNSIECTVDGKVITKLDPSCRSNSFSKPNLFLMSESNDQIQKNRSKYIFTNFLSINRNISNEHIKMFACTKFCIILVDSTFSFKSKIFILFINKRLVTNIKLINRIIEKYKRISKQSNPFVFIEITTDCVDVNVHPAKSEVLIGDSCIFDQIVEKVEDLLNSNELFISNKSVQTKNDIDKNQCEDGDLFNLFSKNFESKSDLMLNNMSIDDSIIISENIINNNNSSGIIPNEPSFNTRHLTKNNLTDSEIKFEPISTEDKLNESSFDNLPSLNEFFKKARDSSSLSLNSSLKSPYKIYSSPYIRQLDEKVKENERIKKKFMLRSLKELQDGIKGEDEEFFKNLVFVGNLNYDFNDSFIFVQHQSNLIKIKKVDFLFQAFYQKFIRDFGNFECIEVKQLIHTDISEELHDLLKEYFSIQIEKNKIIAVPKIFDIQEEHVFEYFKDFNVKKTTETDTIQEICKELAKIFSHCAVDVKLFNKIKVDVISSLEIIETMSLLTDLKELYKGFDRC